MKSGTVLKIFLLSLFVSSQAAAQNLYQDSLKFDHIFPGDNLRENSVTCFLQDRRGFIWIGTKGGLFRYNGYNFTSFKKEPKNENSLSDNFVRCIIEYSADETILVGTDKGGLDIFDKETGKFSRFLYSEDDSTSISNNSVWDIVEDEDGKIWLATAGGGLNLFSMKSKTFKKFSLSENGSQVQCKNSIRCLYLDTQRRLWVGTRFCGLFYFDIDSKTFHRLSEEKNFSDLKACDIWSIAEDGNKNLWVGTYSKGIFVINSNGKNQAIIKNLNEKNGIRHYHITKITRDSNNTMWVSTWGGGLFWYDQKSNYLWAYRNEEDDPESISSNLVLTFFEDNAGSFWGGTHAGGINIYQPQKWKFTPYKFLKIKKNTVHSNSVRSIYFDDQRRILYVGSTFGLYEFAFLKSSQPSDNRIGKIFGISKRTNINAICPAGDRQNFWLGTNKGLFRFNTATHNYRQFKILMAEPYKPDEGIIVEVVEDKKRFLWVISATGKLYRFSPQKEKFEKIMIEVIGSRNQMPAISSVLIDQNNRIYLGTHNGVLFSDADKLKFRPLLSDSSKSKEMQKTVITIFRDAQELLWMGTWESGLYRYDEKTGNLSLFTVSDGLASNHISAMLEDKNGFLYISTDNGISRFDPYTGQFVDFGIGDGLHSSNFETNSCYKTQNGLMFFGGINGYSYFDPMKLKQNRFMPPVYITGFETLYAKIDFKQNIMYTSSVRLNYKMNSFSIEFVALNFINPRKNKYLYKLEGYDRDWQETAIHRQVTYKNVPPGKYTFRVIGSNNDGVWNEQGDSLEIYIKPPFWQTAYFRVLLIFFFIGSIYLFVRQKLASFKKEAETRRKFSRALIENQEKERKRIATELHDSLGQDLLVIKNQSTLLLQNEQKKSKKRLAQIQTVADQAISDIRQIALDLHPYQLGTIGLTDCLRQMIKRVESFSEIKFSCKIENIDGLLQAKQEINIYRICQEILNNILKHSGASNARITIQRTKQFVKLNFSDDGIGFEYDRELAAQHGLGLSDIKERIEILNGRLTVETKSGSGTKIKINIPIN